MWTISVPVHDPSLRSDRFIIAHPREIIGLKSEFGTGIFTLVYSKANISVRFDGHVNNNHILVVLLHHVFEFLKTHIESSVVQSMVEELLADCDMHRLRLEVDSIKRTRKLERRFYTAAYHFERRHGALTNIFRGYEQYPPQSEIFFRPSLAMTSYKLRPILFYNSCHVTPVPFGSYDFSQYVTVLNPSPVYEPSRNFVVRDYHNDVRSSIVPCFKYKKAEHAKLSWFETNDVNEYTFLLNLNEKYYEVLAIYPKARIEKQLPKLSSKGDSNDIAARDVTQLISRATSNEPTSQRLKEALGYNRFDEMTAELESVRLEDWLLVSVRPYMHPIISREGFRLRTYTP